MISTALMHGFARLDTGLVLAREAARKENPKCRPSGAYWRCKDFLEAHECAHSVPLCSIFLE